MWDWDEAQFASALADFDVVLHHPHPPGFPLYIGLAKVLRLFVHSDFHALQAVTTLAAITLFPLLYWLGRELRFPFGTAYSGSLLFAFLPNVWFYGGTAFSDIPGVALVIAACAMLLRGCRDRRAYFAGALLLGLAAAIRPQALAVGCAPALIASWCRVRESRAFDVVRASAIGIFVLAVSYGSAALASESVAGYIDAVRFLREYVRKVDSFLSPSRPPVLSLFGDFFIRAIPGGRIVEAIAALALVSVIGSIIRRDTRVWILLGMFLPFNIVGWFMLDTYSISRYAIGYAPMYALLAAHAFTVWEWNRARVLAALQAVTMMLIIARLIWWTVPALREVRSTQTPPVMAMRWIRASIPQTATLYAEGGMRPMVLYLLPGYDVTVINDPAVLPPGPVGAGGWFVTEGLASAEGTHPFVRNRERLYDIARHRYFEVSVLPAASGLIRFGTGWYEPETFGTTVLRWMAGRSETWLPPVQGNARLAIGFDLPTELVPRKPVIEVRLNGQLIDRFGGTPFGNRRQWVVPSRPDGWNELVITMDKVLNPAKEGITPDARDLGLNLTSYSWGPV